MAREYNLDDRASGFESLLGDNPPGELLKTISKSLEAERIDSGTRHAVHRLAAALEWEGLLQIARKDYRSAWKTFCRWCAWEELHLQFVLAEQNGIPNARYVKSYQPPVFFALAAGRQTYLKWFAPQYCDWLADPELNSDWYGHLYPFLAKLLGKALGFDFDTESLEYDLGPYSGLLENWTKPRKLKPCIEQVCEYHDQTRRACSRRIPDENFKFGMPLPWDLIAFYRLRERLGLKTPLVDHPDLREPLFPPATETLKPRASKEIAALRKLDREQRNEAKKTKPARKPGKIPVFESDAILVHGPDEELNQIEDVAVIDWRASPDEVLDEFHGFLPKKAWLKPGVAEDDDGENVPALVSRTGQGIIEFDESQIDEDGYVGMDAFAVADAACRAIEPEFEAHSMTHYEGDTVLYLVRPKAWWDHFRAEHPKRYAQLFH